MSRASRTIALGLVAPLSLLTPVGASAAPPQDKKRKDLMDQLGMPNKKKQPDPPPEDTPDDDAPTDDTPDDGAHPPGDATPGGGEPSAGSQPQTKRVTYTGRVRKLLDSGCASCHASGASAGSTRFVITGNLDADYRAARRLVDTDKPKASLLLTKAAGQSHAGGATFPAGQSKHRTLLEWIEGGALKGGGSSSSAPAPKPKDTPAPAPAPAPGGAKPKPKPKPKPDSAAPESTAELETAPEEPKPVGIPYAPRSHQVLMTKCDSCHAEAAMAGGTALVLTSDPTRDYATARALVDLDQPSSSLLLTKARGQAHAGGATLDAAGADYGELLAWIEGGALGPTVDDLPVAAAGPDGETPGDDDEPVEVDATTSASARADEPGARLGDGTPVPESAPSRLPFSLPYHLRLNGRFDLAYERRDYHNHPFGPGRNALQTYHHFLFLSRSGAGDPFGFNVELITQQFYEFNARFTTKDDRAKFLIKAGKILVPFGNEPLFHTSYGGRAGFDQQLMPIVWSQPGVAFNAHVVAGPVSITSDTYAIQGYGLRSQDGVLNLQGDFSTLDEFRFAVGERVGLSWGPLSGWYSLQLNPLGFDRKLLMQAIDLEFWRLKGVPVLDDLVVGLGLMRADVSGGGPGQDYYHFGSYGMVRYYPIDYLWIQYRWGLRTFDNRRGLYFDDTRMDERDGSSHNLTIGGTYMGFFAALQLFWNLEKANEQVDDFLRVTVGYAF